MAIRRLFLISGAVLITTSAYAADAVVVAEPEPVEYVRVCDAYGAGFFYIPGTETCLKVNGYLRFEFSGGDNVFTGGPVGAGGNDTWRVRTRAEIRFDARSETELGTLRSFIDTRFQNTNSDDAGGTLHQGFIELGGFQMGVNDVLFGSWLGYAGTIIQDDVIQYGSDSISSNQISYTFKGGNGFSAVVAAEQGMVFNGYDYVIDDYMPHVLAGVKYQQGWGQIGAVVGYDSVQDAVGVKARLDVSLTDAISAWIMAGYQSDYDSDSFITNQNKNWYGLWEGDWAGWGGFAIKVTDKATINGQAAYEEQGTWALALNVNYELVPGFFIRPEIDYTKFGGDRKEVAESDFGEDDALGGIIRFQRNF
ncbi:Porin subfamily protein [Phyllobacterium sp. YR620]|uniref:porin n=1 Tax=Phyllobacterium sp. YR620 TaxID=1881066 RepID=UPI00088D232A|nr:porin [Phyllobacterium sp. YR620]SDP89208.1 Porin subfamily protein [Phyllobacterium sp. YR620]